MIVDFGRGLASVRLDALGEFRCAVGEPYLQQWARKAVAK